MGSGRLVLTTVAMLATGCRYNFDAVQVCDDAGMCRPIDGGDPDAGTTQLKLKRVDIGARHVCGLTNDNKLYCWGDNTFGELGIGTNEPYAAEPRLVGGTWTDVSLGDEHTCALRDGVPFCWGNDIDDQVDGMHGTYFRSPTPAPLDAFAPATFERIFAGGLATCALASGRLWCWGRSIQLGNGDVDTITATQLPGSDWTEAALGQQHACAISTSQGLMCWGVTDSGQAGSTSATPLTTPTPVPLPMTPLQVSAGAGITCVILGAPGAARGQLWCFGYNGQATLATPSSQDTPPHQIGTSDKWSHVAAGDVMVCGIDNGRATCWGTNGTNGIGNGKFGNYGLPLDEAPDLGPADNIVVFKASSDLPVPATTVCKQSGDQLTCWGENADGQFGNGIASLHRTPTEVKHPANRQWRSVIGASDHACGKDEDGALYCWGGDYYMQITAQDGHGFYQPCVPGGVCDRRTPTLAPAEGQNADDLATTASSTCARKGATISCWGDRDGALLGTDSAATNGPLDVPSQTAGQWIALSGSMFGMCGSADDQSLQCWGTVAQTTQPVTVMSDAAFQNVRGTSFGTAFGCGVNPTSHARVCWGDNSQAQLGAGTQNAQATPLVLDTGIVAAVAVGGNTGCMLETTGHVACWGSNEHAAAGGPDGMPLLSPTRINDKDGELTGCTRLAIAQFTGCALCNGVPECWGRGLYGGLGRGILGVSDPVAAPVSVPAGTYVEIATMENGGCVVSSAGKAYCWGEGVHGSNGDGSSGSPYPVPAATVLP
ncbi:MAG TPA: hypothetical protein VGM90_05600 [Kofleriaceae bacterium]|jgi:alpha-tubulin suppressor-like RCC1 family protein